MPVTPEETSRALLEAVELMNKGGKHWTRGTMRSKNYETGEYSYCSVGAIREVTKRHPSLRRSVYRALNIAIDRPWGGDRYGDIMFWNDSQYEWSTIRAAFKKAARQVLKSGRAS